jgi:uracil-DNA glycosylase
MEPSDQKLILLKKIADQIQECQKCGLCKTATQAVPGHGDQNAKLVFIGEAPGFQEDQTGLPFVGRSGKLLDFLLGQIGMSREQVWIGNIIKHRPPENRDPTEEEILACKPYLTEQLQILKPELIVTLGRFSMNYFLPNEKISQAHGNIFNVTYRIYPVYHPAAALRSPQMKNALILDFLKIKDILNGNDSMIDSNSTQKETQLSHKIQLKTQPQETEPVQQNLF